MRVLITGADSSIGRALSERLLQSHWLSSSRGPLQLLLIDRSFPAMPVDPRVRHHVGDIADPRLLRRALADGVQCVFHLAAVPADLAERDPELGQRVNVGATLELFNQLREQARPPVLVYASSLAVHGADPVDRIEESALPKPAISYGTHKVIGELLLRDFSRRGWIDGRALRLPAVVGRLAATPSGDSLWARIDDVHHALEGDTASLHPLPSCSTSWWMSSERCVDNLLHAASLRVAPDDHERTWTAPAVRATAAEIVQALAGLQGDARRESAAGASTGARDALVDTSERVMPKAAAAGFAGDGRVDALLRNALLTS